MPEDALPGRIEGEIAFTERWANIQGSLFYGLTGFKIVAAASIPIILSVVSTDSARLWAGVTGGLVAIVETFTVSFSLKDRFAQKRLECEALKQERWLYLGRAGVYAETETPEKLLVERVEAIIEKRIKAWAESVAKDHPGSKKPGSA